MAVWMIYGSNGYTGELIAREARQRGMEPILAGRNRQAIAKLGQELGCATRVFGLNDPAAIRQQLAGVSLVLLCAGPFSATSQPMLAACMQTKTHYLDITGEIDVFEAIFRQAPTLVQSEIVAIPGVGFDIVPTDCLAALLKREMPDATSLRLVFAMRHGQVSRGTMLTSIEGIGAATKIRKDGQIVEVTAAGPVILPFGDQPAPALPISWGDVSTAFYSTGIPNIATYIGTPGSVKQLQQYAGMRRLLGLGPVRALLKSFIGRTMTGPTAAQRAADETLVWGEVSNDAGRRVAMRLHTPEGYTFTIDSAVTAVSRVLEGTLAPGAYTPSLAFGPEFVLGLQGVRGPESARGNGATEGDGGAQKGIISQ